MLDFDARVVEMLMVSFAHVEVEAFLGRKLTEEEANSIRSSVPQFLNIVQSETSKICKGQEVRNA